MHFYIHADDETAARIAIGDLRGTDFGSYAAARSGVLYGAEVPSETPLFHDVFNVGKKSPHMMITGPENSGKTGIARTLLHRHAMKGDHVFAIGDAAALANENDDIYRFGPAYSLNPFQLVAPRPTGDAMSDRYAISAACRDKKRFLSGLVDLLAMRYAVDIPRGNVYEDVLSFLIDSVYRYKGIEMTPSRENPSKWAPEAMPSFSDFATVLDDYENVASSYPNRDSLAAWSKTHLKQDGTLANRNSRRDKITFYYYQRAILYGKGVWGTQELYALHTISRIAHMANEDPELETAFLPPSKRDEFGEAASIIDTDNPLFAYLILEDIMRHVEASGTQRDSIIFFDDVLFSPSKPAMDYVSSLWNASTDTRISIWVSTCEVPEEFKRIWWKTGTRISMGDISGRVAKDFGLLDTPAGSYRFYALSSQAESPAQRAARHRSASAGAEMNVIDEASFSRFCHELGIASAEMSRVKKMVVIALIALQQRDEPDFDDVIRFWADKTWKKIVCEDLSGGQADSIRKMANLGAKNDDIAQLRSKATKARVLAKRGYSLDSLYKQETRRTESVIPQREILKACQTRLDSTVSLEDVMIEQHGVDAIRRFFINAIPTGNSRGTLPVPVLAGPPELLSNQNMLPQALFNGFGKARGGQVKMIRLEADAYYPGSQALKNFRTTFDENVNPGKTLILADFPTDMGQASILDSALKGSSAIARGAALAFLSGTPEKITREIEDKFNAIVIPVVPYDLSRQSERNRATVNFLALACDVCGLSPEGATSELAKQVPLLPMYNPSDLIRLIEIAYADCLGDGADPSLADLVARVQVIADDLVVYLDDTKAKSAAALEKATMESSKPGGKTSAAERYLKYSAVELIGDLLAS